MEQVISNIISGLTSIVNDMSETELTVACVVIALLVIGVLFALYAVIYTKSVNRYFKNQVIKCVDSYRYNEEFFDDLYKEVMETVVTKEGDESLRDIPRLKVRYKKCLSELVEISKDNIVFCASDEQEEEFSNKYGFLELEDKKTNDIIRSLPAIAEFRAVHSELTEDIYNAYLMKILSKYYHLWNRAHSDNEADVEECKKLIGSLYDGAVGDKAWYNITTGHPFFNDASHKKMYDVFPKDPQYKERWISIFVDKMNDRAKSDRYASLCVDLGHFFEDVNKELGDPEWFKYPTVGFIDLYYGPLSSLNIEKCDRDELMRIHSLYTSGTIKGNYYTFHDPKYKK